jgi:hypothetical protein
MPRKNGGQQHPILNWYGADLCIPGGKMRNPNRRSFAPFLMLIAGVILIAGAVISGILLSRPVATPPTNAGSGASGGSQVSLDQIPRIGVEDARSAFDSGEAVFVDVRDAESFAQGHIPGSHSVPLSEMEARLGEVDREAWIITYCT